MNRRQQQLLAFQGLDHTHVEQMTRIIPNDVTTWQDNLLRYDPAEYRYLLQIIIEGKADVLYGSRFTGDCQRVLYF